MNRRTLYWFLIAAAALAVAFAPVPFPAPSEAPTVRSFRIEAGQYAYSPGELQVNPGDQVTLELVSTDVVHGLYLDGYGISMQADPGQTATLTFIANRPGAYRFRCSVTCGALHPFMIGKLMVGTDTALVRGIGLALVGALGILLFNRDSLPGGMLI